MSPLKSTPPFLKKVYIFFGPFPNLFCSILKFATYALLPTISIKTNSCFKLIYFLGPWNRYSDVTQEV